MKSVHEYFGEAVLPFLGIDEKIVETGPTEIPVLMLTQMYMDFTFLTESGKYLHFEFQTTNGGTEDLQRFHSYEAHLHYNTGRDVITYVIFTGDITMPVYEETYGINTYRTVPISMKEKDADTLLECLKAKRLNGEHLTREDFVGLALTPVMGSRKTKSQRIFDAIHLVKDDKTEDSSRVMAVLYAFAEKFMKNDADFEKVKEVMRMTRLGQMLFDEGLEQGRELGLEQGRELGLEQGRELGLEQGRELGLEQGRELGLELGLKRGLEIINSLNERLLNDGRLDDLKRSAQDRDFQKVLLDEYHLNKTAGA